MKTVETNSLQEFSSVRLTSFVIERKATMNIRDGIYHSLWAGGALLVVSVLAFAVWLTLCLMGDVGGASGAKGIIFVSSGLWAVNFIGLVVMTAVATLQLSDKNSCN